MAMSASGALVFSGLCAYKGEERFYRHVLMPAAQMVVADAERAHRAAIWFLAKGWLDFRETSTTENEAR